jgi:hypothetical protein
MKEPAQTPHEQRRGRLNNGNLAGDFTSAARCGAKTRRGTPCQCPAMGNGRCRLHGGLSTGPKTAEGIARIRRAVTKHGRNSARARAERRYIRGLIQACRNSIKALASGRALT